jgi:translation initiation factor RLI1
MNTTYIDKTDKGRIEITTRQFHLAGKLRPLLVMIDGKSTSTEILKKVAGLGLDENHLNDLLAQGFIVARKPVESKQTSPKETSIASPEMPVTQAVSEITATAQQSQLSNTTQTMALKNFFNETIKSTLGLRGFTLQLKVERAESLADFSELRTLFLEAVQKSKGQEMAHSLQMRLDQLLQHA